MADAHEGDLDLNPDGGLTTLVDLRAPVFHDSSISNLPALVRDPNELRLERMLRREHLVHGVPTPYVGRRVWLERCYNAVRDTVNRQELHTIGAVGVPGAGKTRLVAEMFAIIDPIRRGIEVLTASCSESEPADGVAVIAQLVRSRFKISASDSEAAASAKIARVVENLVQAPVVATATRLLGFLAGLRASGLAPDAGEGERRKYELRAVKTFFNLVKYDASHGAQIMVIHRAQFLTSRAVEVFAELIRTVGNTPTTMLFLSEQPPPPAIVQASPVHVTLTLEPLPAGEVDRLVRAILHKVPELPQSLIDDVVKRSAGNPGLVEDNIRLLIQRGVITPSDRAWDLDLGRGAGKLQLAGSKQDASTARIHELSPKIRNILMKASVFGEAFWLGGLLALMRTEPYAGARQLVPWVDDRLELRLNNALMEARLDDLVLFRNQTALEGELEFSFAHRDDCVLLYQELPDAQRQLYHRMAAQWFAGLDLGDPRPWYDIIAFHLEQGGRPDHAAEFYLEAAQAAAGSYNHAQAIEFYRRALALVDVDRADILIDVLTGFGDVSSASGDFAGARRVYGALLEATLIPMRMDGGALAWLKLGRTHRALGDYERAQPCFDHAENLYRALEDQGGIAAAIDDMAKLVWLKGGALALEGALDHFREALSIRRQLEDPKAVADSQCNIANIQLQMGDRRGAEAGFREAMALRRRAGDRQGEAMAQVGLGAVRYADGDSHGAIESWRNGLDLAEVVGDRELIAIFLNNLGEAYLELGDAKHAASMLKEARGLTSETGDQRTAGDVLRNLARLAVAQGHWSDARVLADEAMRIAEAIGARPVIGQVLRTQGTILGHQLFADDSTPDALEGQAVERFERSMAVFAEIGDELELSRTLRAYAQHLTEHGEQARADELSARADAMERKSRG